MGNHIYRYLFSCPFFNTNFYRFCEYPQEIGVAFLDGVINITQVQLLSHQHKIATRIEIFVGSGNDYLNCQFARLGYLSLDNNERSQYKVSYLSSYSFDRYIFLHRSELM